MIISTIIIILGLISISLITYNYYKNKAITQTSKICLIIVILIIILNLIY